MVEQWTHKPLVGGSNPPFAIFTLKGFKHVSQSPNINQLNYLLFLSDSEPLMLVVDELWAAKPLKNLDAIEPVHKPVISAGEMDDFV
jgi:hypothetical protein